MIHALFCLARPDLDQNFVTFATFFFVDLVRCVNEEWDMLVMCIRDGRIPDLDDIGHLRVYLQASRKSNTLNYVVFYVEQVGFNANPARADTLREIGPPSSEGGWTARVWSRLRRLAGTCLPQVDDFLDYHAKRTVAISPG